MGLPAPFILCLVRASTLVQEALGTKQKDEKELVYRNLMMRPRKTV